VRVMICDDSTLFRRGLARLLTDVGAVAVSGGDAELVALWVGHDDVVAVER
jgi:hypothetical protein